MQSRTDKRRERVNKRQAIILNKVFDEIEYWIIRLLLLGLLLIAAYDLLVSKVRMSHFSSNGSASVQIR
jgi:hypothetical protein